MDLQDLHVGNQLMVSAATDSLSAFPQPARDPIALNKAGVGIPGSIFANGVVLIGNPLSYPAIAEAAVMISFKSNHKSKHTCHTIGHYVW